ncbi:hypothetical protein E6R62_16650 [Streptomyces sp. A1136]|nr:hypothetical protein E6R62_16650 [Streptomyces sp. A1136]
MGFWRAVVFGVAALNGQFVEPLVLPWHWSKRSPGPRPMADRLCPRGILYMLCNGVPGNSRRRKSGSAPVRACRRRPERWPPAGVFDRLHRILLSQLDAAGRSTGRGRAWRASAVGPKRGHRHRSVAGPTGGSLARLHFDQPAV